MLAQQLQLQHQMNQALHTWQANAHLSSDQESYALQFEQLRKLLGYNQQFDQPMQSRESNLIRAKQEGVLDANGQHDRNTSTRKTAKNRLSNKSCKAHGASSAPDVPISSSAALEQHAQVKFGAFAGSQPSAFKYQ